VKVSGTALKLLVLAAFLFLAGCAGSQPPQVLEPEREPDREKAPSLNAEAFHHFTNAVIYEHEQMFGEAVAEYRRALSFAPKSLDVRLSLAELLSRLDRHRDALDVLLPLSDKTVEVRMLIGNAHRHLGQDAKARQAYESVLILDSSNVEANYQLGLYAAQAQDYLGAGIYYHRAARISRSLDIFEEAVRYYTEAEQFDSAAVCMESVLNISGGSDNHYVMLAYYYYRIGSMERARETLL
jgi:tetratricopeptide (TPR) repeat protein